MSDLSAEKVVAELREALKGIVSFDPPACDAPVCIGGECCAECERYDRSREHWLEDSAHRLRDVASPERLLVILDLIADQAARLEEVTRERNDARHERATAELARDALVKEKADALTAAEAEKARLRAGAEDAIELLEKFRGAVVDHAIAKLTAARSEKEQGDG